MNALLDARLIAAACLVMAVVVVVVVVVLVASTKRVRALTARLTQARARGREALELVRRYESDACLAATLRTDLDNVCAQLQRYQALTDAETDLARMEDEAASMFARIDAIRHAAQREIDTLQSQVADLRRELEQLEHAKTAAHDEAVGEPDPANDESAAANSAMSAASG